VVCTQSWVIVETVLQAFEESLQRVEVIAWRGSYSIFTLKKMADLNGFLACGQA
jgi:hypothetical protein